MTGFDHQTRTISTGSDSTENRQKSANNGDSAAPLPCKSLSVGRTQLSMRPHCEKPEACVAKSDKHCKRCLLVNRNRAHARDTMRALWRRADFGERQIEGIRRAWTPERRAEQSRHIHEKRMGWCPPSWRPTYFALRAKKLTASEAREMVESEIAREEEKARKAAAAIKMDMIRRAAREKAQAY